jgi:hypothetical protein
MNEDLPLNGERVRDDFRYVRGDDPIPVKVLTFYLGKHGPFTEKFDAPEFTPAAVSARVETIRTTLRAIPR